MNNKASISPLLRSHDTVSLKYVSRPLLDIREAAIRLGCSERFVRRLVQERRIPFVKLGGTRLRFLDNDLDQWIAGQRIEAIR